MIFCQRALANAASLALPAALILRVGAGAADLGREALVLAHLARAAAAILALPAALIKRLGAAAGANLGADTGAAAPRSCPSSFWRASILSWISAALRSCCEDRVVACILAINPLFRLKSRD